MRRRRWIRRIGALLGTVALGVVLGFLIPTIVAEYSPKTPTAASATASLPARQMAKTRDGVLDDAST